MTAPLKVFLRPTGLHSRSMVRVADALAAGAPHDRVEVVSRAERADLLVLHVIDAVEPMLRPHAIIQYCLQTARTPAAGWSATWAAADLVWSYYDLGAAQNFMLAPLGVDDAFRGPLPAPTHRRHGVLTSGYVDGPGAEAISAVWRAARRVGMRCLHVGPRDVERMPAKPPGWRAVLDISDAELRDLYHSYAFVSGLRHVEGFELPAAEGLCCGARALLFDQPATHRWYGSLADYVPELQGEPLVSAIEHALRTPPVLQENTRVVAARRAFHWDDVADEFWSRLLVGVERRAEVRQ